MINKKELKRKIIGTLILSQIIPFVFMFNELVSKTNHFLTAYLFGLIVSAFLVVIIFLFVIGLGFLGI